MKVPKLELQKNPALEVGMVKIPLPKHYQYSLYRFVASV